jgi:hypothetical protein
MGMNEVIALYNKKFGPQKKEKPPDVSQKEKAQARYESMLKDPENPYWSSTLSTIDSTILGLDRQKPTGSEKDSLTMLGKDMLRPVVIADKMIEAGIDTSGMGGSTAAYLAAKKAAYIRQLNKEAGAQEAPAAPRTTEQVIAEAEAQRAATREQLADTRGAFEKLGWIKPKKLVQLTDGQTVDRDTIPPGTVYTYQGKKWVKQ